MNTPNTTPPTDSHNAKFRWQSLIKILGGVLFILSIISNVVTISLGMPSISDYLKPRPIIMSVGHHHKLDADILSASPSADPEKKCQGFTRFDVMNYGEEAIKIEDLEITDIKDMSKIVEVIPSGRTTPTETQMREEKSCQKDENNDRYVCAPQRSEGVITIAINDGLHLDVYESTDSKYQKYVDYNEKVNFLVQNNSRNVIRLDYTLEDLLKQKYDEKKSQSQRYAGIVVILISLTATLGGFLWYIYSLGSSK